MARDFPGTNSNYMDAGDVAAVDITGTALTLACYFWADVVDGQFRMMVAKNTGTSATTVQYRMLVWTTNKLSVSIGDSGGTDEATGATTITTGVWHHGALVKNGTGANSLICYLDGNNDAAITSGRTIQNTTGGLMFGNRTPNDIPFDGRLAEVGLWNVALTAAEIKALSKGVRPNQIRPASLKGYWPLFGTASPERDYSGNGSHTTITGSVPAANHAPAMPYGMPTDHALTGLPSNIDSAIARVTLTPSGTDIETATDSATARLSLTPSVSEGITHTDAGSTYLDLTPDGDDCYLPYTPNFDGVTYNKWGTRRRFQKWGIEDELSRKWAATGFGKAESPPVC